LIGVSAGPSAKFFLIPMAAGSVLSSSMDVSLVDARATYRGRAALRRLFPLYIHDLSPHTTFFKLDDRGRWHPDLWRDWLRNPNVNCYLLTLAQKLVGFAIVGHRPFAHMSQDREHKVCEFFVLGAMRRGGLGRAAAVQVFDRHPGQWELTVLPTNRNAIAFWRSVLAAYTKGRCEEVQVPGDIIMRFESR
jgi:predicted acetyltransferase